MNELRRGTWQVRQVRQQQHAWATNDAVTHDSLGSWQNITKGSGVAININGSFSRQTETCSTCPIREHLLYLSRCTFGKRLYAMLCALVRGFFSSASSAVSYFQRLTSFANILRTSSPTRKLNNQNENNFWKLKRLCQLKSKAGPIFFNTANGQHPSTPRHRPIQDRRDETFDAISPQGTSTLRQPSDSNSLKSKRLSPSLMLLCDGTLLNHDFNCNTASNSQNNLMIPSASLVAPDPRMSPALAASSSDSMQTNWALSTREPHSMIEISKGNNSTS